MNRKAEDAFASAETLAAMVQAMRRRLAWNPDDERALWSLGEALRMQGNLGEALDCCRAVLRVNPHHPGAHWLAAILGEEVLPECAGAHAAPFVREEAFLSDAERAAVWDSLRDGLADMHRSCVGDGGVDLQIRSSNVLYASQLKDISDWFKARVVARLERLWRRIGVAPFEIGRRALQLTTHRHGDFYQVHKDNGRQETKGRRVTFVYYFHRLPQRFSGGDLLLYDTDLARNRRLGKHTRLAVRDNSILFFPSGYYHRVMPVACATENIEDGRLTLNGWIHARG